MNEQPDNQSEIKVYGKDAFKRSSLSSVGLTFTRAFSWSYFVCICRKLKQDRPLLHNLSATYCQIRPKSVLRPFWPPSEQLKQKSWRARSNVFKL